MDKLHLLKKAFQDARRTIEREVRTERTAKIGKAHRLPILLAAAQALRQSAHSEKLDYFCQCLPEIKKCLSLPRPQALRILQDAIQREAIDQVERERETMDGADAADKHPNTPRFSNFL